MKVSIVIPAYNAERWIERCLESIVGQSYENIEIIVLNDGSKDGTLAILRDFEMKDRRIVVIDKENSGTYSTRKAGVERSTGEVVFNADADDFLEPYAIELLVKKMLENDADMVIGNNYSVLDGRRKLVCNKLPSQHDRVSLIKGLLNNEIKGYVWGRLYKKKLLTNLDYHIDQLLQEDVLINMHVFINHDIKIAVEPTPVYNYIIHENSANSSRNPVFIENVYRFLQVAESILEKAGCISEVSEELKLFKCRNWIVYSRLGGKLAKNRNFRSGFYRRNYTSYTRCHLEHYQNIEMLIYRYSHKLGLLTTNSMKKLNNLIYGI